jgi:hypothetical protein
VEVRAGVERTEADAESLLDSAEAEAVAAPRVVAIDERAGPPRLLRLIFNRFAADFGVVEDFGFEFETDIEPGLFTPGGFGLENAVRSRDMHDGNGMYRRRRKRCVKKRRRTPEHTLARQLHG